MGTPEFHKNKYKQFLTLPQDENKNTNNIRYQKRNDIVHSSFVKKQFTTEDTQFDLKTERIHMVHKNTTEIKQKSSLPPIS